MDNESGNIIDFKGGCLTTVGIAFVIWLIIKILPFILILSSLT